MRLGDTMKSACALALLGFGVLVVCTIGGALAQGEAGPVKHIKWRALVVAGDDSEAVFDNAVDALGEMLKAKGVKPVDRFTSDPQVANDNRRIATAIVLARALGATKAGSGTGCLIFITSHGSREGMLMRNDLANRRVLQPQLFDRMLDAGCGSAPTVAIISGCFSGVFLKPDIKAPNRIIITAARADRPSFGCGHEEQYTYFDSCMLQSWPDVQTWRALFDATAACVHDKENALGFKHSEPQASFGKAVASLALP